MFEIDIETMWIVLMRLTLATILGGVIGLEREKARRNAGLRTHMLICLGAALIMCTGEYIFERFSGTSDIDPARLGAQVVSGIGILCAGAIIKEGPSVRGLTTAAGLWCAACIGLAVGSGNVIPAICATLIVVIVLWLFRFIEENRTKKANCTEFRITAAYTETIIHRISELIAQNGCTLDSLSFEDKTDERITVICEISLPKGLRTAELSARLSSVPQIISVHERGW